MSEYKEINKTKTLKRDLILGGIGALFMMLGDLSLSLIPSSDTDDGLFAREAYMNGGYPAWKLTFLLLTGMVAVCGYYFGLRAMGNSIDGRYTRTKTWFRRCAMFFCFTGLAFHFSIGAGAYLTSYTAVNTGREAAETFAADYMRAISPGLLVMYLPMCFVLISHLILTLLGKTEYSRRMLLFHPVLWMAVLSVVPDVRQALGCHIITLDYVMSQCSGNFGPLLWFLACVFLPDGFKYRISQDGNALSKQTADSSSAG